LRSVLDYDPLTGIFKWKVYKNQYSQVGMVAGSLHHTGYLIIIKYGAHRLAYYMYHGIDPLELEIDHINGIRTDNRISNLRLSTEITSAQNRKTRHDNKSGHKGVHIYKCKDGSIMYKVIITVDKKQKQLGYYKSFIYSCLVYRRAAKKYFGKFARL
jgi:hypothetical protein